jgi:hypothetical protein
MNFQCGQKRFLLGAGRDCNPLERLRELMSDHTTPSFFCKLVDDVVYWNTSRLSGKT